ncbi:MAG: MFS transporter [Gammaproteobacteria bacterium]
MRPGVAERPWALLVMLGTGQILSWGTLYYSLAVLAQPLRQDTGWSELVVYGPFSLALLVSGLCAPAVGRWIDRHGGRGVLCAGALLAMVALWMIATATQPLVYAAAWLMAGLAMALSLYDVAFAVVHQLAPLRYRRNITLLTLIGGFASSVFWPLIHTLESHLGWRETLWVLAALHALMLPFYATCLPAPTRDGLDVAQDHPPAAAPERPHSLPWLILAFATATAIFSVLSVFLIEVFRNRGFSPDQAVWLAALIGPMQVLGRVLELSFTHRLRAYTVGLLALLALFVSLVLLKLTTLHWGAGLAFVVLYGLSNGVLTLVRGALPVELYGSARLASLLGQLARPVFISKAIAPAAFAALLAWGLHLDQALWALFALALAALLAYYRLDQPTR